jgi:DNA-binding NtrC family response regulator
MEWASTDTAKTAIMPAFGTETLLLIDDEQFIRELGTRILENAGYRVLTAVGAREGIEIYEREKRVISLVILDLIMPEMSGKACIRQLIRINPKTKILIASGYSSDLSVRESIDLGARGFVSKPFRSTILLQEVRRILDKA